MNKNMIFTVFLLISLIGLLLYLLVSPDEEKKGTIDLERTKEEVLGEINTANEYVKKTNKWMEKQTEEGDIAYFHPPYESDEDYDPKKDVVKYFIAGLMTKDVDIFLSSFYTQTISDDLFKKEVQDKTQVVNDIMNQITRNGKLIEIQYSDVKGVLNSETDKLNLVFIYEDDKTAKVTLQVILLSPMENSHNKKENNTFFITTSAWDIIEQIENRT